MHYRFWVAFNQDSAADSAATRAYVYTDLMENGFCGERGRLSRGLADRFVIGGRQSGELSRHSWAKELYARMRQAEEKNGVQVWGAYYSDKDLRKKQKAIERLEQKLWRREALKPYRQMPVDRDTQENYGYEDDATIVTQELYDALLTEYEGSEDSEHHADLDYGPASPDIVGKEWVVVDCHI